MLLKALQCKPAKAGDKMDPLANKKMNSFFAHPYGVRGGRESAGGGNH